MTYLYDDPAAFAEDALAGLCDAYAHLLVQVPGGVVRAHRDAPKVAVLYGGGSGHYPAFAGVVGPGMGDGAVCGNIFTSPSTDQAVSVANVATTGQGVIFSYGNYAGDVMNFGLATDRLRAEGMQVENVIVTDDVASAPVGQEDKRRGIAGDFCVYKVMGAAAERGDDFDQVVALGRRANQATRTMGVAFAGCTLPGASAPLFSLPAGEMGLGLGIHGEPGLADVPLPRAAAVARVLVERVLAERPDPGPLRAAVILNGLGATKYEELFVLWRTAAPLLRKAGVQVVAPEVGEIITSLDMAGVSLTLMYLDDELEQLWLAPALTPAWTRGAVRITDTEPTATTDHQRPQEVSTQVTAELRTAASAESRQAAAVALHFLQTAQAVLHGAETELGRLDAVAGDGDHGRGMVRGCDAAVTAAQDALEQECGVGDLLSAAGDGWASRAGGTSGVLWGAGLRAVGERLGDQDGVSDLALADAADAFVRRLQALGKAKLGDKTMLDAAVPFVQALRAGLAGGQSLGGAYSEAATKARKGAASTAELTPRVGRARPLAAKSLGTPDPGATSFPLIVEALGRSVDLGAVPDKMEI